MQMTMAGFTVHSSNDGLPIDEFRLSVTPKRHERAQGRFKIGWIDEIGLKHHVSELFVGSMINFVDYYTQLHTLT